MGYIENPKTRGSGIICCIPQTGLCPNRCEDCFFQGGRSYLEPLDMNLPNMPSSDEAEGRVVRVNDGNDSNVQRSLVIEAVQIYPDRFYNTAIPRDIKDFDAPVVLTVNPGKMTDSDFYQVDPIPPNLMFVRVRTNMWNLDNLVRPAIQYYSARHVPVILTFMAYHSLQPEFGAKPKEGSCTYGDYYTYRKRTTNSYYAIKSDAWQSVMANYLFNRWVYSCGTEGENGYSGCRYCGNCLREYFNTRERMRSQSK